ncbi:GGDEF domain-containing protein [Vibrio lentus]|nr:GGDEF domain-containing protein [Vibrio lentus]
MTELTKIANRRQFQTFVEQQLLPKTNSKTYTWVLYLDLKDNFKFVNDKYGHQVGDSILVSFAQRISEIGVLYKTDYDAHCMPARLW